LGGNDRVWAFGLACALAAAGLAGCDKLSPHNINRLEADRASALCASMETAAKVKDTLFEQAAKQTPAANRLALAALARQALLRIEVPLLDSYDSVSKKTSCSGQVHVTLPAGAVRNLGDTSDLTASIKYSVQPTLDRLGMTYQLRGADDLISGIAGADISDWASHLQANGMPAEGAPVPAMANSVPPPAAAAATPAATGPATSPFTLPAAVPPRRPAPPPPRPATQAANQPAGPGPEFADTGGGVPRLPRCQWARTFADRMICSDPALEAEDRRVARLYRQALAQDPTGEVRRVAQSERAAREGCQDRECIVEWFKQREADLSRE